MSLKNDFNNTLRGLAPKNDKNFIEKEFVNAIIDVLQSGNYRFARVKKVHGKKTQFNTGKRNIKREICDIFLILRYKDHYRFSFIQNKRKLRGYQGLSDFMIDAGQHYFLVKKPVFSYNKKQYSLLHCAIYDTVTAYSVFYIDTNGDYDFDFASANSCICPKNNKFCCCTFKEKCSTNHLYQQKKCLMKNLKDDFVSLVNADEIEHNPYFGEVVDDNVQTMKQLKCLVKDCGGDEFVSFLGMGEVLEDYIIDKNPGGDDIELNIKYVVAIDLRDFEKTDLAKKE